MQMRTREVTEFLNIMDKTEKKVSHTILNLTHILKRNIGSPKLIETENLIRDRIMDDYGFGFGIYDKIQLLGRSPSPDCLKYKLNKLIIQLILSHEMNYYYIEMRNSERIREITIKEFLKYFYVTRNEVYLIFDKINFIII